MNTFASEPSRVESDDYAAGRADALASRRDESRYDASLDYRDGWKSGEQERWLAEGETW